MATFLDVRGCASDPRTTHLFALTLGCGHVLICHAECRVCVSRGRRHRTLLCNTLFKTSARDERGGTRCKQHGVWIKYNKAKDDMLLVLYGVGEKEV